MNLHSIALKISRSRLYRGIQMLWIGDLEYRTHIAIQQHLSTFALHQKTFPPFKNKYVGRDVVIVATGPSFADYKPIPNAIHIGLNRAFQQEKVPLDYFFLLDGGSAFTREEMHQMNTYRGDLCQKFYGNMPTEMPNNDRYISEYDAFEAKALRFDVDCWPTARGKFTALTYDLSTQPLGLECSTVFAPIQFALWTNPRRLFLVGCDCSHGGHFYATTKNNELCIDKIYEGYLSLKKFAARYYPQTEIISVNPVGLKGLFKDWYQKDGPIS